MVTVADSVESGKQALPMDTNGDQKAVSENNDSQPTQTDPKSAQQHNFRSMADLLRNQATAQHDDVTTSRDIVPLRSGEKNDENENSVQDLRLNGQRNCSSMALREEHLRRWYSGDLGGGSGQDGSFMVDVDGQSSHSGIPSDLSSDGDQNEMANMNDDLDMLENEGDAMDVTKNADSEAALKLSPQSDGDNVSEADHDMRKSKRKQYTPKQRDAVRTPGSEEPPSKVRKVNNFTLQEQLNFMQRQLLEMQSKVFHIGYGDAAEGNKFKPELSTPQCFNFSNKENGHFKGMPNQPHLLSPLGVKVNMNRNMGDNKSPLYKNNMHTSPIQGDTPKDLEDLKKTLKDGIMQQVGTMVDTIMAQYAETRKKSESPEKSPIAATVPPPPPPPQKEKPAAAPVQTPVSTPHTPVSDRPVLNLSPRIPSSDMHPHRPHQHHTNSILDNMPKLPFPFNKGPKTQDILEKSLMHENVAAAKVEVPKPQKPLKFNDKLMTPYFDTSRFGEFPRPSPWGFPHLPFYPPAQVPHPLHAAFGGAAHLKEQEQTEALPLVVNSPKKKRTKVTDTRLSPRAARALLQEPVPAEQPVMHHPGLSPLGERKEIPMPPTSFHSTPLLPTSLPTSVAIPNPSLQHSDVFGLYGQKPEHLFARLDMHSFGTPSNRSPPVRDDSRSPIYTPSDSPSMFKDNCSLMGDDSSVTCTPDGVPLTSTLTPMHLRKAKLMFFYVRYPSSSIIKVFFPDVRFNKNNTAQLVKWFSNFREFYYIQMEKYARQALAEGAKSPEDLVITTDSELYRVLNLHYNRNNQLEVPEGFRITVQATLREFYKAISLNKDTEQSWKKPIYKIIARMDDAVPEYFKSPNWMEQLNDL